MITTIAIMRKWIDDLKDPLSGLIITISIDALFIAVLYDLMTKG